jgi:hypothetical protein
LLRKTLDQFPGKVAVIGISTGEYDKTEQEAWKDAKKNVKIDWPIGLDEKSTFADKLYAPEAPRWSYLFVDKSGRLRNERMNNMDEVSKIVKRLVQEP